MNHGNHTCGTHEQIQRLSHLALIAKVAELKRQGKDIISLKW